MKKAELLDTAKKIVTGERQTHYGTAEDNFGRIANYWTAYLQAMGNDVTFAAADVAVMMILMKVARLSADITHEDSWVDIAGYAACGSEIVNG